MNERTFKVSDAQKLADPERLVWLPPDEITGQLGLLPGMQVADVGAGIGYFAIPMAREVGTSGRVYAVDLQDGMLDILREKVREAGSETNVEPVLGTALSTGLSAGSCDLVFFANVWHELDDIPAVLAEVRRVVRDGGRIAIVDWRPNVDRPPGPAIDHRIPKERAVSQLREADWTIHVSTHVGRYHYLVIAG